MFSRTNVGPVTFSAVITSSVGRGSGVQLMVRFHYRVPTSLSPQIVTSTDGVTTAASTTVASASMFRSVNSLSAVGAQWLLRDSLGRLRPGVSIVAGSQDNQANTAVVSAAAISTGTGLTFTATRNINCLSSTDPLYTSAACQSPLSSVVTVWPLSNFCQIDNPQNWKKPGNPGLGGPCITGREEANCVSNDVKISQLRNTGAARSCVVGEIITLTLRATFVSTAQTRYDVAAYFAVDGGNAQCGTCFPFNLSPVVNATNPTANVCSDTAISCLGPFRNYDGDLCGDLLQDEFTFEDREVKFVCRDVDSNGNADLSACLTWDNQEGQTQCSSILSSGAGTIAKCRCEPVNIIGLTVCAGDQLQCRGKEEEEEEEKK